ncbi:exonuclease SbcC [Anaerococcus sp. HMSC075B03]|uniref:AAA family ATPase n=1 Tax=Anaerococcus sp. HMSC075B03 TaxID=1739537 RepID=UPI0008A2A6A9|nr:AAA family ATPase [Anaerococcus sp. HMSC075B03]OFO44901.1 exonuclease SbcC [Anaerococcus sp. HMSC075B03]
MKPVKLEMYGFMTYKNKTFIDFTKIYDSKIFIISGDTGSGKTTIFDAISFALFGEIQREGFNFNDIRSDFLGGDDPITYVDFYFEIDGKNYRIKRIPNQKAKKTRANVNVSHSVEFYKIENEKEILISDGPQKTDKKIIEVIGLDYNQLNRVMILAQGEFSKFLKSNSDEKAELLSKIFSSYLYKEIEEKLKEASKNSKRNLDMISKSLENEIVKNELLEDKVDDELIKLKDFQKIIDIIEDLLLESEKNTQIKNDEKLSLNKNLENENSKLNFYEKENEQIENYKNLLKEKEKLLEDESFYKNLKNDLAYAEKSIGVKPYYDSFLDLNKSQKDLKTNLDFENENLNFIEEKLKENKTYLGNKDELLKIIDKKKENIVKNLEILNKFENLQKIKDELDKNKKAFEDGKNYKKSIENNLKEKEKINEKIRKKSDELLDFSRNLEKITKEIHNAYQKVFECQNLYEKALINDERIKNLNDEKIQFDKANKAYEKKKISLDKAKENKKSIQINEFRKDLNEKGICPICGRIYKGEIEFLESFDLDIEKIEKDFFELESKINRSKDKISDLEKSIDFNMEKAEDIGKNLQNYKNEHEKLKKSYDKSNQEYKKEISYKKDLEKEVFEIEKIIGDLENKLENLGDLKNIEELENKFKIKKEEIDDFNEKKVIESVNTDKKFVENEEERIKKLDEKIKNLEKEKSSSNSKVESLSSYIKINQEKILKTENIFKNKIRENFKCIDEFLKYLEKSKDLIDRKEEIQKYFENLNNISIRLTSLKDYANKEKFETDKIKEKIENLKNILEETNDAIFSLKLNETRLKDSKNEINSIEKNFNKLKNEDGILYKLSKIADGSLSNVSGREKLNFETFVLSHYFRKILSLANIRLKEMTDGQFTMIRKKQTNDKRKNYGLDIEILDANTGKIRSEASLSGGESFIASLALALGLSDEISMENGGIKIDTLFIDEGFGTLSDDYLEKAIRTIEKLSYDNKFIGLISHVKELKDAIDAKIEVSYSKTEGSSLKVVV